MWWFTQQGENNLDNFGNYNKDDDWHDGEDLWHGWCQIAQVWTGTKCKQKV